MAGSCPKENTVLYKLYPLGTVDIHKLRDDVLHAVSNIVAGYIWQKDAFTLRVYKGCLCGEVCFDENIEDEWFVVYLIFEISKKFSNLVADIQDDDGQFLLIEAADFLPKWMSPEVCDNRVFIYQGNLHIVSPKQMETVHTPMEGSCYVAQHKEQTAATSSILRSIKQRTKGYPGLIQQNQHSVNCFIPANLAALLMDHPQLISVGVNCFCESITSNTKRPKIMSFFRPVNRVLSRVTMTKCQYAQLMFHRLVPDRKEGWATADLISSVGSKALDIGTKLAYGFEFACKTVAPTGSTLCADSLSSSTVFKTFLSSLSNNGYFRGNIEGSRDYQRLLNQAKAFYIDNFCNGKSNTNDTNGHSNANILDLLNNISFNIEKLKREGSSLPPDDDDSWLYDFDTSLMSISERAGFGKCNGNGNGNVPMNELVAKMSKFVGTLSSAVDGVEFPNGSNDVRHVDSTDSASSSDDEGANRSSFKRDGPCLDDFMYDSEEYSNGGDSSLDEDYSSDKKMKVLMKQMDAELKSHNGAIGKDEVRSKAPSKVLASNLVKSCQEEGNVPGPAGIILKQLQIKMPTLCQLDSDDDI